MLGELGHRMVACVTRTLARSAERLEQAADRWPEAANLFAPFAQRIDDSAERLPRALIQRTAHARADLAEVAPRLQSRLLSALSSQIVDAIFGENPQESGTISFGGQTINFVRSLTEVTLTITDDDTGEVTTIVIPTFIDVQP